MTRLAGVSIAIAVAVAACAGPTRRPITAPATAPASSTSGPSSAASDAGFQSRTSDSSLESKESRAVARTLGEVSRLRGVRSTHEVPGVKLERDQLVARVKDKALREYPANALRREGQLLQMFGFAPITFDYLGETMKLLEAQLEGFYEPMNGTMYLAADLEGKAAQATLAHELVHALQDQNWDLKARSSYRPGKGDETLALACLAEGDATSLMMDYVMAEQGRTALDLPDEMVRELMQAGMNGAAIQSVPRILRSTLIAPYIDGLRLVNALRRKAGWAMVDRAWERPPTTTEQVLHLDKWEQHEPPIPIRAPTANALGPGWQLDDEDTLGELGFALTFEEWLETAHARAAAAGWGGDRSAMYTKGDELAFAVHERYDAAPGRTDAFAERALRTLASGLKKHLGKPAIDSADAVCFERAQLGPLLFARKGRDLVITAGPARSANAAWTSASTCAQTKVWADEVLANR